MLAEKSVLAYVTLRGRASLPAMARLLGLPPSTVASILTRLRRKGLITGERTSRRGRGRPALVYRRLLPRPVLACQLDGTQIAGAWLDRHLRVGAVIRRPLKNSRTLPQALRLLRAIIHKLESAMAPRRAVGVALSLNAIKIGGRRLMSSVLPWADRLTDERLSALIGRPVRLVALARVLADYQNLAEPLPQSLVRFHVGDGISAHAMLLGRLHVGQNNLAGELGHMAVDPQGPLCGCGRRGCLEVYCSGPAIYRQVLADFKAGVDTRLPRAVLSRCSPRQAVELFWRAWQDGNCYIRSGLGRVWERLGWGLGLTINLLDPEMIVMGGYLLHGKPDWMTAIQAQAQRWVLRADHRTIRYEPSAIGLEDELRVIGSGYYHDVNDAGGGRAAASEN